MHDTYVTYVVGFGKFESVYQGGTYSWFAIPMFSGIVGCLVQISYAYRIYTLRPSRPLYWVIVVLALTQLVCSIVSGVASYKAMIDSMTLVSDFNKYILGNVSNIIWGISGTACDLTIAGCMSHLLSRLDPGFKSTKLLISKIVRMTMETGTLTATAGLMYVVLVVCGPIIGVVGSYYITIAAIMGKLYSNSLLVIFNSRAKISGSTNGAENSDLVINSDMFSSRIGHRLVFRRSLTVPDPTETLPIDISDAERGIGGLGSSPRDGAQKETVRSSLEQHLDDDPRLMDPRHVPSRSNPPPKIDPGVHGFVFIR
ncbi:hypothetical protein NP233_g10950 [Leucocoprinus birnbaumii]|uniref:DUF6534 domain-containing protein n=1 Tax=Leucocoprinus birnbaumii TaxID=56174 RepID=A0AAD5YRE3_9AGAR|nr:hypothetical protein NP233_g10950 [Leucocoprinus birnbaumii]